MIIVLLLILGFVPFVAADIPLKKHCHTSISYMNDSTYKANLELLSTTLSTSASSTRTNLAKGFVGTNQDRTYGAVLCQGDGITSACPECITTAFHDAWRLCGSHKDTHILYADCIVHISTKDLIYDSNDVLKSLLVFTDTTEDDTDLGISTKDSTKYRDNIKLLLQETARQAAYNSLTRYATGRMDLNSTFPLLYSLAQCNLDLPPNDCWDCLDKIRSTAKNLFYGQPGEWIAGVWCNLRYNTYQFYEGQPMQQITWSASVDPTTNMTAPQPAPGPVGVPFLPSPKHKSKQENRFFLSPKLVLFLKIYYMLNYSLKNEDTYPLFNPKLIQNLIFHP